MAASIGHAPLRGLGKLESACHLTAYCMRSDSSLYGSGCRTTLSASFATGSCLGCVTMPPVLAVGSFVWSRLLKPLQKASAFFADVAPAQSPSEELHLREPTLASPDVHEGLSLAEVPNLSLHTSPMLVVGKAASIIVATHGPSKPCCPVYPPHEVYGRQHDPCPLQALQETWG